MTDKEESRVDKRAECPAGNLPGQVVFVLQGGGALGCYQAGVYQALHEAGIEPDWIIGTSIGAINASLIAGSPVHDRMTNLKEFWKRMERTGLWESRYVFPALRDRLSLWSTFAWGVPRFFEPNLFAQFGDMYPLESERAGYYSVAPLQRTLQDLVDFDHINRNGPRLTVGAAHLRSSQMRYFDSRERPIDLKHVLASAALPPAFPPVRIDGELYWDGGILSNTPSEVIFDDNPRRDALVFSVHLWNPTGTEPNTMTDVFTRHKDIRYSSRIETQIKRQQQIHRLRHVINELEARLPEEMRHDPAVRELTSYGCQSRMHVIQLLAPQLDRETHTKDVDFSPGGIARRWEAGYAHASAVVARAPWRGDFDPLSGVVLHDASNGGASATDRADSASPCHIRPPGLIWRNENQEF